MATVIPVHSSALKQRENELSKIQFCWPTAFACSKMRSKKTRKKTQDTEKKVQEIVQTQKRAEEQRVRRETLVLQREAEERELRAQNVGDRDEQQKKTEQKQRMIMQMNSQSAQGVRQERVQGAKFIQQQREDSQAIQFARADRVRKLEGGASRSRAKSESAKHENAQQAIRERVNREEDMREVRQKEVERMESEEAALMQKLQMSQARHRAAFMQLEDVLKNGSGGTQPGTPSGSQKVQMLPQGAAALASASAAVAEMCGANSAADVQRRRPPRPRAPPGAGYVAEPSAVSRASAHASQASSSRVTPRTPQGQTTPAASRQTVPQSKASAGGCGVQRCPSQAMSSCSTASGLESGQGNAGSGNSTPCSAAPAPKLTYTTVDGTQLEIPTEEDLDLASLLNG